MQEVVLQLCGGEQAIPSKPALLTSTHSLLNIMALEDVVSNAPKAADWVSSNACLHKLLCHAAKLSCMIAEDPIVDSYCHMVCDLIHTSSNFTNL